ncbi:MAG: LacI family DNA-binding transcriptional regulator [Clostridia bacterium]|nr:LacI family DNA-binding transcriptional regulator [Clostridia bacterium]
MNHKIIARLSHVSPSTVSKALSGSSEVSPETAEKIRQIAIDVGYFKEKNKRKRNYSHNRQLLIALIVPEVMGFHYSSIITYIKNEVEAKGGNIAIYVSDFSNEKANNLLKSVIMHSGADGVIMFALPSHEINPNIPIITIGSSCKEYDSIKCDMNRIINDSVEYLYGLGHKKIGFVGEYNTISATESFKHITNCPDDFVYIVNGRFETIGIQAAERIILQKNRPTALICAYDEIAISLIHQLNKNSVRVPDDISVMGINNISSSAYAQIPLTTVDTFSSEQYKIAIDILFDKIINETQIVKHMTIEHKLIERETTKKQETNK